MTNEQKAELVMVLHTFKENRQATADPDVLISLRARILNIEAAIEQIIDVLIDDAAGTI
jgi:hypothetical protein